MEKKQEVSLTSRQENFVQKEGKFGKSTKGLTLLLGQKSLFDNQCKFWENTRGLTFSFSHNYLFKEKANFEKYQGVDLTFWPKIFV